MIKKKNVQVTNGGVSTKKRVITEDDLNKLNEDFLKKLSEINLEISKLRKSHYTFVKEVNEKTSELLKLTQTNATDASLEEKIKKLATKVDAIEFEVDYLKCDGKIIE